MCGRYATTASVQDLVAEFKVEKTLVDGVEPSYNVAPTQQVLGVLERPMRGDGDGEPVRQLESFKWGLVPSWASDPKIGSRMINARSETLTEKRSFRAAAARRRLLLPAQGFYEWEPRDGKKLPWFLHDPEHPILAFAGLYELWPDPSVDDDDLKWLATCTIVTRPASDALGRII